MVALNFKARFVIPIELGDKRQTIRAWRKRPPPRVGQALQLYTGPRMKPRKIGEATITDTALVILCFHWQGGPGRVEMIRGEEGEILEAAADLDEFARLDGFADWSDMRAFWAETHDIIDSAWAGRLIRWGDTFRGGVALQPHPAGENP